MLSVTDINVDKTPPTLSGTPSATGWSKTDVTVTWGCSDVLSGIGGSCPVASTVTGEGYNLSVTATVSDKAGNKASTTVSGIQIDRTAPTTRAAADRAANDAGWYKAAVTVTMTGSDNLSGIAATYYSVDGGTVQPYNGAFSFGTEGTHTITFWSTDAAGNVETAGAPLTLKIDGTAPTTTVINPISPDSGWFVTSGIPVAFGAKDAESGIAATYYSIDGGGAQTYGEPFTANLSTGKHTITYWSVDLAGNAEAKATIDLKVDTIAPTITPESVASMTWRNTPLAQAFTASDSGSGLKDAADASFTLTASAESAMDGNGNVVPGTDSKDVYDIAGNKTTRSVSAWIDLTAPTITASARFSDGSGAYSGGWTNKDVIVSFECRDALSGLAGTCPADVTVDADTLLAGRDVTASVADNAGNTASVTFTVKRDATAPAISQGTASGTLGANEWYTSAVTVPFTAQDALSGLADPNQASFTKSTGAAEGSAVKVNSGTVADIAGNRNPGIDSAPFKVDLSNPTDVTFSGSIRNGQSFYFGDVPAAPACTATDAVSGLQSCIVTGYGTAVGSHTLTATATDKAGRTATATLSYEVKAWTTSGFYQPVDMCDAAGNMILNTVKAGSTVPLKFEVFKGATEIKDVAAVKSLTYRSVTTPATTAADEIETLVSGSTSLRFDTTGDQFIYNWKTPAAGTYIVTVTLQDGSKIEALFKTR